MERSYKTKEELFRKAFGAARNASCAYDGDWLQEIESYPVIPCDRCMVMDNVFGNHDENGHKEWNCQKCQRSLLFVEFPMEENRNEYLCTVCADECVWACHDCEKQLGIGTCEFGCCNICKHLIEEEGPTCRQLINTPLLSTEDYQKLKQKFTSYEDMYKLALQTWLRIARTQVWHYL